MSTSRWPCDFTAEKTAGFAANTDLHIKMCGSTSQKMKVICRWYFVVISVKVFLGGVDDHVLIYATVLVYVTCVKLKAHEPDLAGTSFLWPARACKEYN